MILAKTEIFISTRSLHNIKLNDIKFLIHEFLLVEISKNYSKRCLVCKIELLINNDFVCKECFGVIYYRVENQLNEIILEFYRKYELVKSNSISPSKLYNEISFYIESEVFKNTCYRFILINLNKMLHIINIKRMMIVERKAKFKMLFISYKSLKYQYANTFSSDNWESIFIIYDKIEELLNEINVLI
ncbi:hypothetical protein H312_00473 [Anncaliia algerae PRA339]|uniref:Uncharacterized protein n=1 Tax=Anncaliia algerae PRA339 TaxID=1288291 RepID=A0A059F4V5_9MICR|nr:hypothetical protein H312_00473 [Anncaliia algerae PRA339]